ncbi:hypothetical protein ACP70R_028643 [Stipagrostis hirtigluma subsp. patula]
MADAIIFCMLGVNPSRASETAERKRSLCSGRGEISVQFGSNR